MTYGSSINLTGYTTASLTFWYKSFGDADGSDYGQVFIDATNIGGGNQSGGTRYWGNATWTQVTIDLTPYVGSSHTLKFKWINDANQFTTAPDPPMALDDITLTASTPLGTATSNPLIYSTGGASQICFNNSHINTTTPTFRVSATANGVFDTYQIEVNTNSTFTGTAYTQTFGSGSYTNGTQYNLTFSNGIPSTNGAIYYARVRSSGNGGTTWSSWSSQQHSFVYDGTVTATEWFQDYQAQYQDVGYTSSNLRANSSSIDFTPFSGGSNPFTDPGLNSGTNWSKTYSPYVSGGTPIYNTFITTDDNGTGGKTESTGCARFSEDDNSWQSFVNGEFGGIYQQVNLTGITNLTWDATVWRNTQSNVYQCGVGRSCHIVYGFEVVVSDNAGVSDASGTVVYLRQPTVSELPEFGVKQYLNETVDISSYGFTGNKYVKFIRIVTNGGGVWYDDEKWYLDNIRTSSTAPTTGSWTSAPAYLASINGAFNWSTLKWNQTLNGGSITFNIQKYNGSSWANISGLTNLSATGDGDKSVSIATSSDAQIRIVMNMTQNGTSPVLNNWALTATACTAPTVTAQANGTPTSTTVASGTSVSLTSNAGTGTNCSDYFEYAWFDGTSYWNGSSFGSGSAVYDASYTSASFTASSTRTYTVTVRCHASSTCLNTSQVVVNVTAPPASISAVISSATPNGTSHKLTVSWPAASGITTYGLEYSTDGSAWTTIGDISAVTYEFDAGDNPNAPYYFRVRSKLNSVYSSYATMATPTYTACDYPALPTVAGLSPSSVSVAITPETPVANPSITNYSIYCTTTSQYVQANGTLGSTEVYQTAAAWGTKTVTGLSALTSYCFYAKAKNNDGDVRYTTATAFTSSWGSNNVEDFDSYTSTDYCGTSITTLPWMFCTLSAPNGVWTATSSAGCTGNALQYTSASASSGSGSLMRSAIFSAVGQNTVVVSFDMTNSYNASYPTDKIYMWVQDWSFSGGFYNSGTSTATQNVFFDHARNCERVTLTFDISALSNKSNLTLGWWSNAASGSASHSFNVVMDNIGVSSAVPTACATTCTPPSVSAAANPTTVCLGSSSTLTASGSAATYSWSPTTSPATGASVTATPSAATTYTVTATASGCVATATVSVGVNPVPTVTVNPPLANICTGSSINLTASGANTYSWAPSTNLSPTTGATVTATVNSTITYTVTGTDGNGCSSTATAKTTAAGSFSSPLSGTVTVGSGGTYSTFTVAGGLFSAINTNGLSGPLTVQVVSDISNETGAVQLGNFASCGGPYTITIQPDGANLRTIAGGPYVSGTGLLAFNGSSNVVIDGSFGGSGKYLKFTNNPSFVVYTTLGFINDAHHITVKNCIIEGTAIGDNIGCIQILTAASIGNCYLTFDNNDIGNSSYINTRVYCSGTAGHANHDIAFTNNNIFNFLDGGNSLYDYGINVTSTGNGNNWTITGNSFYATGVCNSGAYHQSAISLLPGSSSTGNIISGNYIGGNLPLAQPGTSPAPGYYCSNNSNSGAQESDIINVNCGTVTISNNVIKNMRWTGNNQNTVLLNIAGSTVANVTGNQFGDATYQVSNTSAYMSAIIYSGNGSGCQFTNNTITNLRTGGASIGTYSYGIYINQTGAMANLLVQGNSIEIPRTTTTGTYLYGIQLNGSANLTGSILRNKIYDNSNVSGGSNNGIGLSVGTISAVSVTLTVANNMIALRNSSAPFGIYETSYNGAGSVLNYYYNTVYLAGTSSSTFNSCAYFNGNTGGSNPGPVKNMKNNIFINSRTGGSGTQTTISNRYGEPNFSNSSSDYNLLVNATASTLGNWNGSNQTFAQWQTSSGGDAHSIAPAYNASSSTYSSNILSPANLFVAATTGDLHIDNTDGQSYQFADNKGMNLTSAGITTDYDLGNRSTTPDIGADEIGSAACTTPATPTVTAVNNCNGSATLSTTATGTLLWSNNATTSSINVTLAGSYSVTTTVGGCTSAPGSRTAVIGTTPATPSVSAVNNCNGTSTLSTTATGTLLWSNGSSLSSITVSTAGTYSVTAASNGCTSGYGTAAASLGSCGSTFTVKVFLQGYYIGGGRMSPLMKLLNISSNPNDVDTVTVELHPSGSTNTISDSYKGILKSNGNITCTFAGSGTYYIVVKHRNSLETWSASTVAISDGGNYDFSTGSAKAYGPTVGLETGVQGIYSGDINRDKTIDNADKFTLQSVLSSFIFATYNINDVTGDGFVDEDDLRILQNNAPIAPSSVTHP